MPGTDGYWNQDTPYTDMEIFVGASEFKDIANLATVASASSGLFTLNLAAGAAGNFCADVTAAIKRTGVYATPALTQEQYGTAASQPGPTLVSGTSDPEGIRGYPPYLSSTLATLRGPVSGPVPKGVQLNSVDVIYNVTGLAASLAQIGVFATNFVDGVAGNVVNLITLGANGLPTAIRTTVYRFNIPVPTGAGAVAAPYFMTLSGTELSIQVKLTAGASTGAISFYGCVCKCSYNFN